MRQGKLEVFIKSDGRELPEYHVEAVDDKTLACYIPSEVGKTFEICWRGDTRCDVYDTSVRCYVDGRRAGKSHCAPGLLERSRWGIREAEDRRRPFMFASLVMTDDDSLADESETQPDLGTVKVKLVYVVEEGQRRFASKADRIVPGMVHERSKNIGVQRVSLGDGRECPVTSRTSSRPVNPEDPVYARFLFRYRSKDFLQAQGITRVDEITGKGAREDAITGRKRSAVQSLSDVSEAGPNRKRPKTQVTAPPSAPTLQIATVEDDEVMKVLREELISAQGRVRIIEGKIQARMECILCQTVKQEQQSLRPNDVNLAQSNTKREGPAIFFGTASGIDVIDLTLD